MKLEQQDDLYILTIHCHAKKFFIFVFNKHFFKFVLYNTAENEGTIRDLFINCYCTIVILFSA